MPQRIAVAFVAVLSVVAIVIGANALLRPGCAVLPVALPTDPDRATPASRAQACAVLGRPVPEIRFLPLGLRETGLAIDGPPPAGPDTHRIVHLAYGADGAGVALLEVMRGERIPDGIGAPNATVAGAPAVIEQRRYASAAPPFDEVSYSWARDGLFQVLRVRLAAGFDRDVTDRLADSVR